MSKNRFNSAYEVMEEICKITGSEWYYDLNTDTLVIRDKDKSK